MHGETVKFKKIFWKKKPTTTDMELGTLTADPNLVNLLRWFTCEGKCMLLGIFINKVIKIIKICIR